MDCQTVDRNEVAEKYMRGELDPAAQDDFEVHILECTKCLQAVEVLQAVSHDLTERAPEIRSHTTLQHWWFQWRWVAIVPALVGVCVLGIFQLHRAVPSAKPALSHAASNTPQVTAETVPPSSGSSAERLVDNVPMNGRNYTNLTLSDSQMAEAKPPRPGPSRKSNSSLAKSTGSQGGTPSPSPGAPNDAQVANLPLGLPENPVIPNLGANSKAASGVATNKLEANNDEVAKELFRLGMVQPPPYTFSGFAAQAKDGKRKPGLSTSLGTAARSGQSPPTEAPRPTFQDAMGAYVEKRYADAADLLEEDVRAEPNAPDVNFYLGVCLLIQAKPADAVAPLLKVVASEKSSYTQSAHFYLAKAYVQTGNLAEAEAQLQAAAAMQGHLTSAASSMLTRLQALQVKRDQKPN